MLVGGKLCALHGVAHQPHLRGNIVDGDDCQIGGDGTDTVNADLTALVQDLVLFHNADGVKTVGAFFAHIPCRPGKHMGLDPHAFCLLDQRLLQIGGTDNGKFFHVPSFSA